MTRLQFIQMNQVNTELYLSKRPISAKNYELGLISSDYRLKKLVRQSLRNLTRTLSNSLGEIVIVQENYVRIKNLDKLFIEFVRQKTTTRPPSFVRTGSKLSFRTIHDHMIDKLFENLILIRLHLFEPDQN